MIQFLAGVWLMAVITIIAIKLDPKSTLGSQAIIEINKCEEELPRNQKCVLYARAEVLK